MKKYFEDQIFMEFKATHIDTANVSISANILSSDITKNLEKIAKELTKTADLAGFRKGKVPVAAIKQHYGSRLREDAEAEALRDVLDLGLKELSIDNSKIITEPTFSKFNKNDNGIEVVVEVSLRPTVEIGDYISLVPDIKTPTVTNKQVEARINEMLISKAPFVEVDKAIENGDTTIFDFEGFVDGVAFEGGKAEGYSLNIGSGSFIPGFEEQLIGLKKGDEKEVKVTFPEEYQSENLKGKEATFKCKIERVEIKGDAELTDITAKELLGDDEVKETEDSITAIQRVTKETLKSEALSKKYNEEIKPALREALAKEFKFDLPKSVVEKEIEQRLNQKAQKMTPDEIKEIQESEDKLNELKATFQNDAEQSVRTTFIIDALGEKEGVNVSDEEVKQVIYYEGMMNSQNPDELIKKYEDAGYLPLIKMSILEDKVLTKILDDKFKK